MFFTISIQDAQYSIVKNKLATDITKRHVDMKEPFSMFAIIYETNVSVLKKFLTIIITLCSGSDYRDMNTFPYRHYHNISSMYVLKNIHEKTRFAFVSVCNSMNISSPSFRKNAKVNYTRVTVFRNLLCYK